MSISSIFNAIGRGIKDFVKILQDEAHPTYPQPTYPQPTYPQLVQPAQPAQYLLPTYPQPACPQPVQSIQFRPSEYSPHVYPQPVQSEPSEYIYILKLKQYKWYIGRTVDVTKRMEQHISGTTEWTKLYEPIHIERQYLMSSPFDEDLEVKKMMAEYGIDNVRGGSYSSVQLTQVQQDLLRTELNSMANHCFKCNQPGHFANKCPRITCYKCKQVGHYASACTSITTAPATKTAKYAKSKAVVTCYKCQQVGHYANKCTN